MFHFSLRHKGHRRSLTYGALSFTEPYAWFEYDNLPNTLVNLAISAIYIIIV